MRLHINLVKKKRNKNWFEIIEMIVLIIAHIGKC